jgi:hypothetical protein
VVIIKMVFARERRSPSTGFKPEQLVGSSMRIRLPKSRAQRKKVDVYTERRAPYNVRGNFRVHSNVDLDRRRGGYVLDAALCFACPQICFGFDNTRVKANSETDVVFQVIIDCPLLANLQVSKLSHSQRADPRDRTDFPCHRSSGIA